MASFLMHLAHTVTLIVSIIGARGDIHHGQSRGGVDNIRLPPAINPNVDIAPPVWDAMPDAWWYGPWYVTHSSNKKYQALHDLVWALYPVLPTCGLGANSTPADCPLGTFAGQTNDLSTWFANSSSTAWVSAFGYDTPRRVNNASAGPGWVDVFDTVGAGELSYFQNGWQFLAWGYDGWGNGWALNFETAVVSDGTPACLDILSRVAGGPGGGIVEALEEAVRRLQDKYLSDLFLEMKVLAHDNRRERLPPFVCGPYCVNNTHPDAGDI